MCVYVCVEGFMFKMLQSAFCFVNDISRREFDKKVALEYVARSNKKE